MLFDYEYEHFLGQHAGDRMHSASAELLQTSALEDARLPWNRGSMQSGLECVVPSFSKFLMMYGAAEQFMQTEN
jgi:hypothetical protein